ncbi:hypothetical protein HanRHA438_Chr04g0166601 [Helianthus annuus]|nr:hypothetical protein HanRHA438_Chr04g0166601 [Helianthus annuus]
MVNNLLSIYSSNKIMFILKPCKHFLPYVCISSTLFISHLLSIFLILIPSYLPFSSSLLTWLLVPLISYLKRISVVCL